MGQIDYAMYEERAQEERAQYVTEVLQPAAEEAAAKLRYELGLPEGLDVDFEMEDQ